MSKTKNDLAWEKLFDKYNILYEIENKGFYEITSKEINEFREARLATKFDHKTNLPKLFTDNHLSILPITRGSYIISSFEAYKEFNEINIEISKVPFPDYIESIDYENITSESIAINCAFVSGILSDFLQDNKLVPTVSGRMSSNEFSFYINNLNINRDVKVIVSNSQIEIDGGYEGTESLALIEAKNSISEDFLIRQLYYPFRLWNEKITKRIKPIFMVYSNGIFTLYEYSFQEPNNYNSLVLVKQKNYTLVQDDIDLNAIKDILYKVNIIEEPRIQFPQANSMKRLINLCELLYNNDMTKEEITTTYDFDPRQTNYYTDAGIYLGIIDKKREDGEIIYFLTHEGRNLFKVNLKTRQLKLIELILKHNAFNKTLKEYFRIEQMPSKDNIVKIMKESNLYRINSDSTFYRRAQTISSWISWILNLAK
ncbi:type II restriction enzyme [Clostridium sp. Cult2]|uniref:type II restriction enzyme n=1 Tax=Clostridium sp. Cult2 TaxID=2079003 RepID=UPI001F3DD18B|nr:transcriptional regulator [Clostridium sp. Cult2]MCF6465233.1 transcriptional regulator [Clostridium sp. Cult2]